MMYERVLSFVHLSVHRYFATQVSSLVLIHCGSTHAKAHIPQSSYNARIKPSDHRIKAIGTPAALVPVLDRFRKSHASTTGSEDSSLNSNQAVQTKLPEFVAMGEPDVMLHMDTETFQFPLNC